MKTRRNARSLIMPTRPMTILTTKPGKSGCPVEQIVSILKQVEMGLPVADLVRRVGIIEQT
jgi:hypothetical protein